MNNTPVLDIPAGVDRTVRLLQKSAERRLDAVRPMIGATGVVAGIVISVNAALQSGARSVLENVGNGDYLNLAAGVAEIAGGIFLLKEMRTAVYTAVTSTLSRIVVSAFENMARRNVNGQIHRIRRDDE
ncbi:MAG: hypothetical protein AAB592_03060 [Patescibacteria group bacterium]